jgi:hypothetical protein
VFEWFLSAPSGVDVAVTVVGSSGERVAVGVVGEGSAGLGSAGVGGACDVAVDVGVRPGTAALRSNTG